MLLSGFFFVQVQQQGSDPLVVEGTEEADRVVVIITKTKNIYSCSKLKYLQIGVYINVNLSLKNLERTNRQENNLVKLSDVKIVTKGLLCPFSQFNNFQLPHLDSI